MKRNFFRTLVLSAIGLLLIAANAAAQRTEREQRAINAASSIYVISAEAGGVNFVEGKVAVARKDAKSGYLIKGDELEIGDKVSTGAGGKAEILLNPGSYVRLGENTDFEFVTTELDNLKVKITRGSAIFEVIADREFRVSVATPKADFYVVKSGVYRIDVLTEGAGRIEVWRGSAEIGDGKSAPLKKGQSATVNGGETTVAKFDRDEKDALEAWSKERAKDLAKINSRLNKESLRNSLMASSGRWNIYNSYGLWIFDASHGSCFLPFGYGWSSPYGYWYGYDLWNMNLPWYYYYPTTPHTPATQNSTANTSERPPRVNQSDRTMSRGGLPPFVRVQRDLGDDTPMTNSRTNSRPTINSNDFPSVVTSRPEPPPPVVIAPPSNPNTRSRDN
jgi:FecR protein